MALGGTGDGGALTAAGGRDAGTRGVIDAVTTPCCAAGGLLSADRVARVTSLSTAGGLGDGSLRAAVAGDRSVFAMGAAATAEGTATGLGLDRAGAETVATSADGGVGAAAALPAVEGE